MALPNVNSPIWTDIVSGKKEVGFEFLAVKIFLGTARIQVKNDPGKAAAVAKELYALFEKNQSLPSVQKDVLKLK